MMNISNHRRGLPRYTLLTFAFSLLIGANVTFTGTAGASSGFSQPLSLNTYAPEFGAAAPESAPSAELVLYPTSADDLLDRFTRLGYSYDSVLENGDAVPRVRVLSVPEDIADIEPVADRKALFFKILLPLVLRENDRILAERREIQVLQALSGGDPAVLNQDRRDRLDLLLERYRMDEADFDELLLRADIIPPSLALAQAAIESGWGTSRFAQEGNALYGQITTAANSLISERRDAGTPRRYAAFRDVADATTSYMRNLNTHRAYSEMRQLRQSLAATDGFVGGDVLAEGLLAYSERGADYVAFVQQIIRTNDLLLADSAQLSLTTQVAENPL
jgi:Bax protein